MAPLSRRSCGVRVWRTSTTGAKPETTSDMGEVTLFSAPSSSQRVFIDIESLPTGMVRPSCGQSSMPTALTVSYSRASSPGWPAAAIQLADNLMSDSFSMRAAARLVSVSPMAIRPDAGASSSASGVRSPMAMASPVLTS